MKSKSGRYIKTFVHNKNNLFYTGTAGDSSDDAQHFYLDENGKVEIKLKDDTNNWGMNRRADLGGIGVWNDDDSGNEVHFTNPSKILVNQGYAYELVERVNMYGGFPNIGNPGDKERHPAKYKTVLQPNDTPHEFPDNSNEGQSSEFAGIGRVLVQANDFTTETVCDGFVLQHGYLNTALQQRVSGNFADNIDADIYKVSGAGVLLRAKGVLENCIISDNRIYAHETNIVNKSGLARVSSAAGVFNYGGIIKNCQITNNELRVYNHDGMGVFAFGAGCFMQNSGTNVAMMYNTLITNNTLKSLSWNTTQDRVFHSTAIGAGICLKAGNFFNNTIVDNKAVTVPCKAANVMNGGAYLYSTAKIYNSIIYDNKTKGGRTDTDNRGMTKDEAGRNEQVLSLKCVGTKYGEQCSGGQSGNQAADSKFNTSFEAAKENINIYHCNVGWTKDGQPQSCTYIINETYPTYETRNNTYALPNFVSSSDFHLQGSSPAVNKGTEYEFGTATSLGIPSYDAEYNDRVQDCTIDMGAYEYNGAYSITPDETTSADKAVFYVTQNGRGTGSAANPENAACWQKLQKVLDAAGRYKQSNQSKRVIVKLAKFDYMPRRSTESNATEENPRTYSIIVPKGVEVWGGYSDTDDFATRDVIANKTTLSGLYQSEGLDVNVYHVVTFTEDTFDENGIATEGALASITDKAVLDGLFIENGDAEGEPVVGQDFVESRYGGAAIVKKYAHVRNCIIRNNKAVDGGGAFCMEQGALVTGCVIDGNSALSGRGGAIYVRNTTVNSNAIGIDTNIARVMASTIVNNSAEMDGGGIYFGEAKVRVNSAVRWKNVSNGDHNVCGQTDPGATDASQERNIEGFPLSYCAV